MCDFSGCSSPFGRLTFITNAARRISTVGGSLRDIQLLAGHSALSTTQRYIEADAMAQRRVGEVAALRYFDVVDADSIVIEGKTSWKNGMTLFS